MNIAIILSGGTGTRLGSNIPKQYLKVENNMIINYCMKTFVKHSEIDFIQIVAEKEWQEVIIEEFKNNNISLDKFKGFSLPGASRQGSIFNALKDIKEYVDNDSFVIIHDAARPLLSEELITRCFDKISDYDGVLPVINVKDTMYLVNACNDKIESLLDRNKIVSGQAPEVFNFEKYYQANISLTDDEFNKINGSTEPAVLKGMNIAIIDGEETNFKITTKEDLDRFKQIICTKK